MLIPFLPIRFRKYINRKKYNIEQPVAEVIRKDLTEFIRECIMIIDREKENGTLTDAAGVSYQKIKESIQDIFSLDEAEAEEKMKRYWVQKDE